MKRYFLPVIMAALMTLAFDSSAFQRPKCTLACSQSACGSSMEKFQSCLDKGCKLEKNMNCNRAFCINFCGANSDHACPASGDDTRKDLCVEHCKIYVGNYADQEKVVSCLEELGVKGDELVTVKELKSKAAKKGVTQAMEQSNKDHLKRHKKEANAYSKAAKAVKSATNSLNKKLKALKKDQENLEKDLEKLVEARKNLAAARKGAEAVDISQEALKELYEKATKWELKDGQKTTAEEAQKNVEELLAKMKEASGTMSAEVEQEVDEAAGADE